MVGYPAFPYRMVSVHGADSTKHATLVIFYMPEMEYYTSFFLLCCLECYVKTNLLV